MWSNYDQSLTKSTSVSIDMNFVSTLQWNLHNNFTVLLALFETDVHIKINNKLHFLKFPRVVPHKAIDAEWSYEWYSFASNNQLNHLKYCFLISIDSNTSDHFWRQSEVKATTWALRLLRMCHNCRLYKFVLTSHNLPLNSKISILYLSISL